jgi:hypothetical protein
MPGARYRFVYFLFATFGFRYGQGQLQLLIANTLSLFPSELLALQRLDLPLQIFNPVLLLGESLFELRIAVLKFALLLQCKHIMDTA